MKAMTVSHKQPAVSAQGRHLPNSPHARRRRLPPALSRLRGTQEEQSPQVPGRQSKRSATWPQSSFLCALCQRGRRLTPPPSQRTSRDSSPFRAVISFREPKSFRIAPNTRGLARHRPTSHSRPSVAPRTVRDPNSASVLVPRNLSQHPQKTRDFPL